MTQAQGSELVIRRTIDGKVVGQREGDGYVNGTALCQAAGKKWSHYAGNQEAKEFIQALAESTGIPVDSLIEQRSGRGGGSWVHPKIAIHLAQWCSAAFAVQVSDWVFELLTKGHVDVRGGGLTEERVVELAARVVGEALRQHQGALNPSVPRWNIAQRLAEHRWHTYSEKQHNAVRRIANELIVNLQGAPPSHEFGRYFYLPHQVHLLDRAIEIVRAEAEHAERGGMFANAD